MKRWPPSSVFRTTKCFSPKTNGYPGGFPVGFLKWCRDMGWWGDNRCYLCSGGVDDGEAVRVDLRAEANATHREDARHTTLPDESFDCVILDPPYSKELAEKMYGLGKMYSGINAFAKEAGRLVAPGGLVLTLSYEVPKRIKACSLIACCGVYQVINVAHMRCFTVWRKEDELPLVAQLGGA